MPDSSALKQRFKKFFESLKKEDMVAVLHHTDPDGVTSGVIMAKLVEKIRGKKPDLRLNQLSTEVAITDSTIKKLRDAKITKVIMSDLCVDQVPDNIYEMEKFAEILIIDHHKIYKDLNSEKTIFIKPQYVTKLKPASYPASKLCYDLANEIADLNEIDWVAAIGVIGDCGFVSWKDFLDGVFSKYSIKKKQDIFETALGKAASLISNAESFDISKVEESFNAVYDASSYTDVLNSSIVKYHDAVENEIKYWIDRAEEFGESFEDLDLIMYMIKPKFKIKAGVSTRIHLKYPNKTIIVMQETEGGKIDISGRRRDEKVAVNSLLEKAVEGLEGARAGGHIPAAGAKIMKKDLQIFKEKIISLIKNGQV